MRALIAYLDTNIVSGLAREDLVPKEQTAIAGILGFHERGQVRLVTSPVTGEEIDRLPAEFRQGHATVYDRIAIIPCYRETPPYMLAMGIEGGTRYGPLYAKFEKILPQPDDARHVYHAIERHADYFVTADKNTILNHREKLESICTMKFVWPSELVQVLEACTP